MKHKALFSLKSVGMMALLTVSASVSQAAGDCLLVEVGGVSTRIESLSVMKPKLGNQKGAKARILVHAKKVTPDDLGEYIVTPFECSRSEENKKEIICTQPDGGGDFFLVGEDGSAKFEFESVDFGLGATSGLPPRKDEDPLTDEYELIQIDENEDGDHPVRVSLKTESGACPKPKVATRTQSSVNENKK